MDGLTVQEVAQILAENAELMELMRAARGCTAEQIRAAVEVLEGQE